MTRQWHCCLEYNRAAGDIMVGARVGSHFCRRTRMPPTWVTRSASAAALARWLEHYNTERRHSASEADRPSVGCYQLDGRLQLAAIARGAFLRLSAAYRSRVLNPLIRIVDGKCRRGECVLRSWAHSHSAAAASFTARLGERHASTVGRQEAVRKGGP